MFHERGIWALKNAPSLYMRLAQDAYKSTSASLRKRERDRVAEAVRSTP
jgi:hypothetical protein